MRDLPKVSRLLAVPQQIGAACLSKRAERSPEALPSISRNLPGTNARSSSLPTRFVLSAILAVLTATIVLFETGGAGAITCPASMAFGETIDCSISGGSEVDTYTFNANSGDRILTRMVKTSGNLYSQVKIFRPNGTQVCSIYGSTTAELNTCLLDTTGTHTVRASDRYGTGTGNYYLHLQRANAPGGATALSYGSASSGNFSLPSEYDAFTFTGSSGDRVLARLSETTSSLSPKLRIYRPDGTEACSISGSIAAELNTCTLNASGTLLAIAGDNQGTNTGGYGFYVERTNGPTSSGSISYDQLLVDSVSAIAEWKMYSLTASANDRLLARLVESVTGLQPAIRVYRPDGTQACSASGSSTAELDTCLLNSTGTFVIAVGDSNGTATGGYSLYAQRTNSPTNPSSTTYGQTSSGILEHKTVWDAWTFTASAGERVFIRASRPGSSNRLTIRVYRPDGTSLCSDSATPTPNVNACLIDASGQHTIMIGDTYAVASGTYYFHLQRTNNPVNATSLEYGAVSSGSIGALGEWDAWTFTGSSGDRVWVRFGDQSSLDNAFRVYRPDGTLLCDTFSGTAVSEVECTLTSSGTHTVLVGDENLSSTGNYLVHVQSTNNPGNSTPILYGQTVGGYTAQLELDVYTFTGAAGERVFARMATYGDLDPWVRIYRPDGTLRCSTGFADYGNSVGNDCLLDASGTHKVVVGDFSGMDAEIHFLFIQRTTDPELETQIAYGDTVSGTLLAGQMHTFTFLDSSEANAFVRMMAAPGYPEQTWLRLYGPDGVLQCCKPVLANCNEASGGHVDYTCSVEAGWQTLIIGNYNGPTPLDYYTYVENTKLASDSTHIAFGGSGVGSVTAGDMDAWNFTASAGQGIRVKLDVSPDTESSDIAIFNPDGTVLCRSASNGDDVTANCTLQQSGRHEILVGEWNTPLGVGYVIELYRKPAVYDPDDPTSDPGHPNPDDGDPVNVATGNFAHSHTDIAIPGSGVSLSFTRFYNSGSNVNRVLGYGWTHSYDMYLTFPTGGVRVSYPDGHAVTFNLAGGTYVPSRSGIHDTLAQNGDGTYTLTTPGQIRFTFSSGGLLQNIKDRNNNTTVLAYTGGLLTSVTDPGGRSLTIQYNASNRIWNVIDPLPGTDTRVVEFTYDANGDLTQVEDVKGGTTSYAYSAHRMTSLTDSNGHIASQNIYDSDGRSVEQLDAVNGVTCFKYGMGATYTSAACPSVSPGPNPHDTVVVHPRGNKTTYTYDESFRNTQTKDALGGTVQFAYDANNEVTCITDQLGNKTAVGYDTRGNVLEIIDAANTNSSCQLKVGGVKWTYAYSATNNMLAGTDPLDHQTEMVYNLAGNLTRVVRRDTQAANRAILALTCIELNVFGQPITVTRSTDLVLPPGANDPCTGNKTKFEYNSYGNLAAVTDPRFAGQQTPPKTTLTPDVAGRVLTVTNELGHTSTLAYDSLDMVLAVTDHLGNTATRTYEAKGNLKTVTDANRKIVSSAESGSQCGTAGTGNNTDEDSDGTKDDGCPNYIYNYDNGGRLVEVIDPLGQRTKYGYDATGNLTAVTNANRQPVGAAESGSQCGMAGTGNNVDEDSDGTKDDGCPSTKHAYDGLNRLTSSTDALGRATSYGYDAGSNLTQRTDARGLVTKYFPDNLDQLDLIEYWNGTNLVGSVGYTYTAVGFRTQMVDSTGTTTYTPDALDRLASVTFPGPKTVAYTYDDLPGGAAADYPGQRTKITYPDSKAAAYTYLANGAMATVTDWLSQQTAYSYNDAGNLATTQLPNGVWTDYGYDNDDRLTSVVNRRPGPITISSFTYTLDAIGNRAQMIDLVGTHSYQYDPLYRLTQVTYPGSQTDTYTYDAVGNRLTKNASTYTNDAAGQMLMAAGVSYGYDNNGSQTARGSDSFAYDHENRLTQSVMSSVTSTNTYNGDGLRMSHTVAAQTTNYTWDLNAGLPLVLQDGANSYVYGLDLISATDGSGTQTYFTYDGLGSTTDLTNSVGTVTDQYSYDVFGAVRTHTGTSTNFWQFTGEQTDGDSGLQYLRARYYDPTVGRFITKDPLLGFVQRPGTQNRYAYVLNRPTRYIDPLGMECSPSPLDWDDCAEDVVEGAEDAGEVIIDTVEDAIVDAADLLSGFASLNCLDFGIGAAGVLASILAPQLAPGIALGTQLLRVMLIEGDMVAFSLSAAINASQIDDKEGISWDDAVNGAGIVVSGVAAIAGPLEYLGGGWTTATIVISAGATAISGYQCLQDGGVL